jgi:16S rRNA (cytosine967-C5)-methyltransferase
MCAGPGGKAALLAAVAVQSGVSLTCNEVSEHRTKLVRQALRPIRGNISVKTGDGRKIGAAEPEKYDRIMLDAPCTGLGALRRRPEARWRKSVGDLGDLTRLQTELIDSAWKALKPGGILAYVTCSPHPAETVGQINSLLKQQPKAELLSTPEVLAKFAKNLVLKQDRKTAQLWPHRDLTDAMFISLIRKPLA